MVRGGCTLEANRRERVEGAARSELLCERARGISVDIEGRYARHPELNRHRLRRRRLSQSIYCWGTLFSQELTGQTLNDSSF